MTILVVTSITHRALDQESLVAAWLRKGYRVIVLNLFLENPFQIPRQLNNYDFFSIEAKPGIFHVMRTVLKIINLCWKYNVNSIVAHLEYPSYASVLAQFFIKAKVIVYRHHADYASLNGSDASLSYQLTYRLAPKVIVVSKYAKRVMVEKEKVRGNKIQVVPIAFNFELFKIPKEEDVFEIRKKYNGAVLLLTIGRLNVLKRPYHSIDVLKRLVENGVPAKLILLGIGEEQISIEKYIQDNKLSEHVFLTGFSSEPLLFMEASDFILHPSISESSSIIVKEAGLVKKPCIVCKGIGDFDDYMIHNQNGFLVSKNSFVSDSFDIIVNTWQNKTLLDNIGKNLHDDILRLFDVNHIIKEYEIL